MTLGLIIRDAAGTPRTLSELIIRDASNTPRTISELWVRDTNNTPRLVFNPSGSGSLAATCSPSTVSGTSAGSGTCTTDATTVTPTGGTAPYTYSWTLLFYSSSTPPTADAPANATTTFTQTSLSPGEAVDAEWRATVTDANGNSADASNTVTSIFVDISA